MEPWNIPNTKQGAGAVIVRGDSILLVQINYGPSKGKWNLPGGRIEDGELITAGLCREVLEETSLTIKPKKILAFRQRIFPTGLSDIYYIFSAEVDGEIQRLEPQDSSEITAVKFWKIDDVLTSEEVRPIAKEAVKMAQMKKNTFSATPIPYTVENDYIFA